MSRLKYYLVNAKTDVRIAELNDGSRIDVSNLPDQSLTIDVVVTSSGVKSVRLNFDNGAQNKVESLTPYALYGDDSGNFAGDTWSAGNHTFEATFYSKQSAGGTVLGSEKIAFAVEDTSDGSAGSGTGSGTGSGSGSGSGDEGEGRYFLVDAASDKDIAELSNGLQVELSNAQ